MALAPFIGGWYCLGGPEIFAGRGGMGTRERGKHEHSESSFGFGMLPAYNLKHIKLMKTIAWNFCF